MLQCNSLITKAAAPYPKTISEINALIHQYNIIITKPATEPATNNITKQVHQNNALTTLVKCLKAIY